MAPQLQAIPLSLVLFLLHYSNAVSLDLHIHPSTVLTTRTTFSATAKVTDAIPTRYKFSFGTWNFETPQSKIVHKFSLPGIYNVRAKALVNSTWLEWTSKEILVFDHDAVVSSKCTVNITFLGLTESKAIEGVTQGSSLSARIAIALNQCYGRCSVMLNESSILGRRTIQKPRAKEMISYGNEEERDWKFNISKCSIIKAKVKFTTPTNTIIKHQTFEASNFTLCRSNGTEKQTTVIPNLTPNKIVAIFYVILLLVYILDAFIAYRGYKQLLKPVQDLTSKTDEHMYEVRIHVGSALSIKSTKCVIQFTLFGTSDVLGPIHLPVASFEDDGIASFLVSTIKEIGDVGSIGIFCKNMDLSSDWYLRKVDVFKHSEKPDGNHWSDEDVITKLAKFECHSWFSPASCTQSVSQVFHKNTERVQRSLVVDYLSRCKQLFLQKHLVTSWKCCYGLESFTKIQRLAILYSFWLMLTCLATVYLVRYEWQENLNAVHKIHIGVIRLNTFTAVFAFASATGIYFMAALLGTVVRLLHYKPKGGYTEDRNFRPLHIDVVRSRVLPNKQEVPQVTIVVNGKETLNKSDKTKGDIGLNNNSIHDDEQGLDCTAKNENCVANGSVGSPLHQGLGTNDVKINLQPVNGLEDDSDFVDDNSKQGIYLRKDDGRESGSGVTEQSSSNVQPSSYSRNGDGIIMDINYDDDDDRQIGQDGERTEETDQRDHNLEQQSISDHDVTANGSANNLSAENLGFDDDEQDGGIISQNVKEDEGFNSTVQFLNRETLPTSKENKLKEFFLLLLSNVFWILHFLLLAFSVLYSLINSASWTSDMAYHWISASTLGMAVCCCLIDTIRVLLYILIITIKERRKLFKIHKQTTFEKYTEYLVASKQAEFEKKEFFRKEFPKEKIMMVKDHYRLKGKVKDFLIFALFVFVLLILTTWTMSSKSFRFWRSLENFLFSFQQLLTIQSKGSVDPIVNFWKWMRIVLPPLLNSTKRDVTTQQYHVLGSTLNLIQKRVIKGQCQVQNELRALIDECNVEFHKKYEDRMSYSQGWKSLKDGGASEDAWHFRTSIMPYETSTLQSEKSYTLEGYIATFNATNINETINELIKYKWIDEYTRIVYLEVFIYNAACNFFSPAVIALEFTASSYIFINRNFYNFVLFPDFSPEHEYVQFAELIFFVLTFYLIFDIFNRKHRMSSTWFSGWLLTEAIVIVLSFVVIILVIARNSYVYQLSEGGFLTNLQTEEMNKIAFYQNVLEGVFAALNLFSIALMMKPLFTLGLFDDMYLAVVQTLIDMKGIAIETIVIIIAFTFWARAAFVASVQSFSTFGTSFPTLMDMLVRPDNSDLYNLKFFGPLLLLIYYCISIMLISNIFISAVQQSYSKARRAFEDMQKGTVLKYLVKSLNKKGNKRLLSQSTRNQISQFRRQTNIRRLDISSDSPKMSKKDRVTEAGPDVGGELLNAVNKLEKFLNARIRSEIAEDRVLTTAISDGWKKVVERKPTMAVISLYKKHLRKPQAILD